MPKQLSPAGIVALKEALVAAYWFKDDLKTFLNHTLSNPSIALKLDWSGYKRQVVSDLVDQLTHDNLEHIGDLTRLCYELCKMNSFNHLKSLDDAERKISRAREAMAQLRSLVEPQQDHDKEREEILHRQRVAAEKLKKSQAVRQKLLDIRNVYNSLLLSKEPQKRGFELERVMYDIFDLFDLDPKASFKLLGEQIDGAFSLDGTEYLFEAKWQKTFANKADLVIFSDKVRTKLENTLGLFLSIDGFSQDGVSAHQAGGSAIILMDGSDLLAVLDERIDFTSLLLRKKRHASQTGNIFLSYREMICLDSE